MGRRVLLLAYHFPPIGGAGVQRSVKFVRYLPDHGYDPVVVTGPGITSSRWTPQDDTLVADIPPGTDVRRVAGPAPSGSSSLHRRAERLLRARTPFAGWWIEGAFAAGCEVGPVDLVYASMSPFESGEAAQALARALGCPWVADLRDPWALDEFSVYPTAAHRRLELRRMQRVLGTAAATVWNTEEAALQARRRLPQLSRRQSAVVPNGFDRADFGGPTPTMDDGVFRIVHTGYLHTELGRNHRRSKGLRRLLGGAAGPVDFLTRSHVYLLEALERLFRARPGLRSVVEVHLAGVLSDTDRAAIRTDVVRLPGYLSHAEAIELMRSADLVFLPMHDLPVGTRARIVPGKTYEYLASGRPILAAVPDGDARDLLRDAGNATLCRPADVEAMARAIGDHIERWRAGEEPPAPDRDLVERFDRRRLAADLARVFDDVLGAAPPRLHPELEAIGAASDSP